MLISMIFIMCNISFSPDTKYGFDQDTIWTKTFGGDTSDYAWAIKEDLEGYYAVAGVTASIGEGGKDIWVLKLNPVTGDTVWSKTYGGINDDLAYDIAIDSMGYYVVVGRTYSFGSGGGDLWILKIDPTNGDTIWGKMYGGAALDWAWEIAIDSEGYYFIVGQTWSYGAGGSDLYVLKINPISGDTLWTQTYGGSYGEAAYGAAVDSSGFYIAVGATYTFSAGNRDLWILKINPYSGDTLWSKNYGGIDGDVGYGVTVDPFGLYVVTGATSSYGSGDYDLWILKIDPSNGDTVWGKTYGGSKYEDGHKIAIDSLGFYIIAGNTESWGAGTLDVWVLKIDPSTGDTLITETYGGSDSDDARDILIDSYGYYIISGSTESFAIGDKDLWVIKLKGFYDLEPPVLDSLTHLKNDTLYPYGPYEVYIKIEDAGYGVEGGLLYWKQDTFVSFNSVALTHFSNNWWTAQIPEQTAPQLQDSIKLIYYVVAWDSVDNFAYSESLSFYLINVDIIPPKIESLTQLQRDTTSPYGPYEVWAKITDNKIGVKDGFLRWKKETDPVFFSETLSFIDADWWHGYIPQQITPEDSLCLFYFVQSTDSLGNLGCSDTLTFWLVNPSASISAPSKAFRVKIPSVCYKTINLDIYVPQRTTLETRVYSVDGRHIFRKIVAANEGNYTHKISLLPSGIYIIEIKTDKILDRRRVLLIN